MSTKLELYFDEVKHKYTDNRGNAYTSVTTLLGKYEEKFDTKKMARICELSGRKGNPKYKGKTAKMLEQEWALNSKNACDYGNEKHNYLETSIKESTGYRLGVNGRIKEQQLITVEDIIEHPGFGELGLDYFIKTKINILYPSIFAVIVKLVAQGYRIYAELGVFKYDRLVSGLIDLFLIKGREFIIIDWKTNKDDISFEAGYWEHDENGNSTGVFINTYKTFLEPLKHLPSSVGYKYTLQLSEYAYLAECFGLTCKALLLCHIRREQIIDVNGGTLVDRVDLHPITYMKKEAQALVDHHYKNRVLNSQITMQI